MSASPRLSSNVTPNVSPTTSPMRGSAYGIVTPSPRSPPVLRPRRSEQSSAIRSGTPTPMSSPAASPRTHTTLPRSSSAPSRVAGMGMEGQLRSRASGQASARQSKVVTPQTSPEESTRQKEQSSSSCMQPQPVSGVGWHRAWWWR